MRIILRFAAFVFVVTVPATALAWPLAGPPGVPPVKVDAGINFRFNVYQQDIPKPTAPWYTYWPAEAAQYQAAPGLGANYPNWPVQWPPIQGTPDNKSGEKKPVITPPNVKGNLPPGSVNPYAAPGNKTQLPYFQGNPTAPPGYNPYGQAFGPRPVAYYQPPGYWYGK